MANKLTLKERLLAPVEYEENLVKIQSLKAKIEYLKERNKILLKYIEKDTSFHKKYLVEVKEK